MFIKFPSLHFTIPRNELYLSLKLAPIMCGAYLGSQRDKMGPDFCELYGKSHSIHFNLLSSKLHGSQILHHMNWVRLVRRANECKWAMNFDNMKPVAKNMDNSSDEAAGRLQQCVCLCVLLHTQIHLKTKQHQFFLTGLGIILGINSSITPTFVSFRFIEFSAFPTLFPFLQT